MKTLLLFAATAVCEIIGCYLPGLWRKTQASAWVLVPAALSLAACVRLLIAHPQTVARTYLLMVGCRSW